MRIALKMSNVWNRNGNVYVEMGGTEIKKNILQIANLHENGEQTQY